MSDADIAVFILARIVEREADADEIHDRDCTLITMGVGHGWCDCPQPERVRARCAVDRQIVAACTWEQLIKVTVRPGVHEWRPVRAVDDYDATANAVLRLMASLDAGHPDYDEDWKP